MKKELWKKELWPWWKRNREITSLNCSLGSIQATRRGTTRQHDYGAAEWGLYRVALAIVSTLYTAIYVCTCIWQGCLGQSLTWIIAPGRIPARMSLCRHQSIGQGEPWRISMESDKWQPIATLQPSFYLSKQPVQKVKPEQKKKRNDAWRSVTGIPAVMKDAVWLAASFPHGWCPWHWYGITNTGWSFLYYVTSFFRYYYYLG